MMKYFNSYFLKERELRFYIKWFWSTTLAAIVGCCFLAALIWFYSYEIGVSNLGNRDSFFTTNYTYIIDTKREPSTLTNAIWQFDVVHAGGGISHNIKSLGTMPFDECMAQLEQFMQVLDTAGYEDLTVDGGDALTSKLICLPVDGDLSQLDEMTK